MTTDTMPRPTLSGFTTASGHSIESLARLHDEAVAQYQAASERMQGIAKAFHDSVQAGHFYPLKATGAAFSGWAWADVIAGIQRDTLLPEREADALERRRSGSDAGRFRGDKPQGPWDIAATAALLAYDVHQAAYLVARYRGRNADAWRAEALADQFATLDRQGGEDALGRPLITYTPPAVPKGAAGWVKVRRGPIASPSMSGDRYSWDVRALDSIRCAFHAMGVDASREQVWKAALVRAADETPTPVRWDGQTCTLQIGDTVLEAKVTKAGEASFRLPKAAIERIGEALQEHTRNRANCHRPGFLND